MLTGRSARCMDHHPRGSQPRYHLSLWESPSGGRLLLRRKCVDGVRAQHVRWAKAQLPLRVRALTFLCGWFSVNVNDLATYQQVYIYVIPILANMGFINIIVVVVRLHWFEKHLRAVGKTVNHF